MGQLSKVRASLSSEVTVVVDERDEVALGETGEQEEGLIERVSVSQKVKTRTFDFYTTRMVVDTPFLTPPQGKDTLCRQLPRRRGGCMLVLNAHVTRCLYTQRL